MATRKSFIFLGVPERITPMITSDDADEFEESEVWNNNNVVSDAAVSVETTPSNYKRSSVPNFRSKKSAAVKAKGGVIDRSPASSLPVNIPDWSKTLGGEYKDRRQESDDDDGDGVRMPPHEYLARTRVASLSVHEGIGRTLKGRDLSRVRNAIWKKTGFED